MKLNTLVHVFKILMDFTDLYFTSYSHKRNNFSQQDGMNCDVTPFGAQNELQVLTLQVSVFLAV